MSIPHTLPEQIADLYHRIAELERRGQNAKRTGTIAQVDAAKGEARVMIKEEGDGGKPYLGPWMPWGEIAAGKISTHFPPSVGQQVKVVSESGDLSDAEIDMSLPSNANPRPHDKEGEGMIKVGNTTIFFTEGEARIKSPKILLVGQSDITLEGDVIVKGDITQTGSLSSSGTHKAATHI